MSSITLSKVHEMTIDEKYFVSAPLLLQDGKLLCEIYLNNDEIIYLYIIDINRLQVEQIITGLSNIEHLSQTSDGRLFCLDRENTMTIMDKKYNTFTINSKKYTFNSNNEYSLMALSKNRVCLSYYPIFTFYNASDMEKPIGEIKDYCTDYDANLHVEVEIEELQRIVIFSEDYINSYSLITFEMESSIENYFTCDDDELYFNARRIDNERIVFITIFGVIKLYNFINFTIEGEMDLEDFKFKTFSIIDCKTILIFSEFEADTSFVLNDCNVYVKNNIENPPEDSILSENYLTPVDEEIPLFYSIYKSYYISNIKKCICIDYNKLISYNIL